MKYSAWLPGALAAMLFTLSANAATAPKSDIDEIHKVMSQFQQAIKDKDKDAMLGLFIDENAPLSASASDKTLTVVRSKKADAGKIVSSNSGKFATSIGNAKSPNEEKFSNIKIDADDAVAAVSFDFTFLMNDKPGNVGKEAWLLVKTEQGWKITSIVYSMNFPEKS
ncbi:MAG: hypothetical protein V4566_02755 [Pseudomonadota bacterium]|jgi:hypothetical protein